MSESTIEHEKKTKIEENCKKSPRLGVSKISESTWRYFWWSCLLVFAVAGTGKLLWLLQNGSSFSVPDPVLPGFSIGLVTLFSVLLELVVAFFLMRRNTDVVRSAVVLWWSAIIFGYRYWFPAAVDGKHCPCFGNIPELLGLSEGFGGVLARTALQCIVAGSFAVLLVSVIKRRGALTLGRASQISVLVLFMFVSNSTTSGAESIRVEGDIWRSKYMFSDSKLHTEHGRFSLLVSKNGERMELSVHVQSDPLNKDPRVFEFKYRTDGVKSVSQGLFDTNVVYPDDYVYPAKVNGEWQRVTNDLPRQLDHVGQAFINPAPFPSEMLVYAIPFCLGFNWSALSDYYSDGEGPEWVDRTLMTKGELSIRPVEFTVGSELGIPGLSEFTSFGGNRSETNDYFVVSSAIDKEFGTFPSELIYLRYARPTGEDGNELATVVLYEFRNY
jgi:hypothetical protein